MTIITLILSLVMAAWVLVLTGGGLGALAAAVVYHDLDLFVGHILMTTVGTLMIVALLRLFFHNE